MLTVSDDGDAAGHGTGAVRPSFGTSTGRGQAHMRERARQLGGDYRFERGPEGARTLLRLPLIGEGPAARPALTRDGAAS